MPFLLPTVLIKNWEQIWKNMLLGTWVLWNWEAEMASHPKHGLWYSKVKVVWIIQCWWMPFLLSTAHANEWQVEKNLDHGFFTAGWKQKWHPHPHPHPPPSHHPARAQGRLAGLVPSHWTSCCPHRESRWLWRAALMWRLCPRRHFTS